MPNSTSITAPTAALRVKTDVRSDRSACGGGACCVYAMIRHTPEATASPTAIAITASVHRAADFDCAGGVFSLIQ